MYVVYKTQGIVLGSYDVGEYDRHYIVFTKDLGKRIVEARGVRRSGSKLVGLLAYPAVLGISCISINEHLRLVDVMQIETFSIQLSFFICDAVNAMVPLNVVDIKMWTLLCGAFRFTSMSSFNNEKQVGYFKKKFTARLLSHSGFQYFELSNIAPSLFLYANAKKN